MRTTLLTLLLLSSCSGVQVKQRADGTYVVECSSRKACLDRAERICGSEGFTVVGGQSNKKLYGVPGNEKLIGKDELFIRCRKDRPSDTPDESVGSWRLKHADADAPPAAGASAAKPASANPPDGHVCRPGETQRCIGPGACDGGQACLADGTGYGPCDCGPRAVEPNAAPSSPPGLKQP
jgi:hypothetical protein